MSECADTSNSMQRRKRLPPAHIHLSATDLQRTSLSMTGTRAACYTGFTFPRHTVGPQIGRKSSTLTRSLRLLSLRQALVLLGLACSAPATLVAALTVYEDYRLHKERIYQATVSIARSMTVDWEREIHGVTAGLNVLAASEELARGDLRGFHAKARQIAQLQNVDSYVLVDARRMQILNTAHDYARPAVLPQRRKARWIRCSRIAL